jgi:hypothetical protein
MEIDEDDLADGKGQRDGELHAEQRASGGNMKLVRILLEILQGAQRLAGRLDLVEDDQVSVGKNGPFQVDRKVFDDRSRLQTALEKFFEPGSSSKLKYARLRYSWLPKSLRT